MNGCGEKWSTRLVVRVWFASVRLTSNPNMSANKGGELGFVIFENTEQRFEARTIERAVAGDEPAGESHVRCRAKGGQHQRGKPHDLSGVEGLPSKVYIASR